MKCIKLYFGILLSIFTLTATAQTRNRDYEDYIDKYKDLAIDQMKRYHIPASITLSQALLESNAGKSMLTLRSNNHFGIKCGSEWNGPYVLADDERPNEHFRAYKSAKDSYIDHAMFLTTHQRYASLFSYGETDYRSWARGLQQKGYATCPSYSTRLISVIENYDLYRYDSEKHHHKEKFNRALLRPHQVYIANDLLYIIARSGDDMDIIAAEFDMSQRALTKYNELEKGYTLQSGDVVYLHKKNKVSTHYNYHVVRNGESLYTISQMYGMQLKYLYKLNNLPSDYMPVVGDTLKLK